MRSRSTGAKGKFVTTRTDRRCRASLYPSWLTPPFCGIVVSGLLGWDVADKKGTAMGDVDPEQAEYVDDMLAAGDGPLGEGSGCLLVLAAIASCVWLSVN